MEVYTETLIQEAHQRLDSVTEEIETVYIGGGTPSLLPAGLMEKLLKSLRHILPMDHVREFTVEANPGTLTTEWLDVITSCGANRISLGMQAYQDRILETLGRIHHYEEVVRAVELCRKKNLDNLNLDLMFGIPGQTEADWLETLEKALSLTPDHISAYGLIPEPGTEMNEKLEKGEWKLPEPETERQMYENAISRLGAAGLRQYEISNFAKEDKACLHNIGYWRQVPYLGLGSAAASMLGISREDGGISYHRITNPSGIEEYLALVSRGNESECEKEWVSPSEARFETMMLALRMNDGISEEVFFRMHGMFPEQAFGDKLSRLQELGFLKKENDSWRLTRKGMDFQNQVLVELMDDSLASV